MDESISNNGATPEAVTEAVKARKEAQAVIDKDRTRRVTACQAAIKAALAKHNCRIVLVQGKPMGGPDGTIIITAPSFNILAVE